MDAPVGQPRRRPYKLGVVSFLNSKPLIEGLTDDPRVELRFAVPSALPELLHHNTVDAALIPSIDLARSNGQWRRISDACIGSPGRTLTVRVFSKIPPERMEVLHIDPDSHTSIVLARLIWAHVYRHPLRLEPITAVSRLRDCESVLLIGDKVVTTPMPWFDYHVDLGDAWRRWTGLPFVFAAWATHSDEISTGFPRRCLSNHEFDELAGILSRARDRGVARAAEIAAETGPAHGWPVDLAVEYMTHALTYTITPDVEAGMQRYFQLLTESSFKPQGGGVPA